MAEDSSTENVNPALVAEIVSSYVGKNSIAVDQIGPLIEFIVSSAASARMHQHRLRRKRN
jgi:predicted transcriptional regulator